MKRILLAAVVGAGLSYAAPAGAQRYYSPGYRTGRHGPGILWRAPLVLARPLPARGTPRLLPPAAVCTAAPTQLLLPVGIERPGARGRPDPGGATSPPAPRCRAVAARPSGRPA